MPRDYSAKEYKPALEFLFFILGLLLFGWILLWVDLKELRRFLTLVQGPGLLVFAFYPVMTIWDIWAWQIALPPILKRQAVSFELFLIRTAGEAVNSITPFIDIGGEPLKVFLISRRFGISKREALSSVVITRTTLLFAEGLFVTMGLLLSLVYLPLDRNVRIALGCSLFVFLAVSMVLVLVQKRGFFFPLLKWLESLGVHRRLLDQAALPLKEADEEIASFYSVHRRRLGASILFSFIGWVFGGIEVYWMSRVLGNPLGLGPSLMVEGLIQLVRTVTFMIPQSLGTQEGGLTFFLQALGYDPVFGFALSLLKRIRQLLWTGVGFLIWASYRRQDRSVHRRWIAL